MFSVYVIRSETAGKIYIGHTQDLEKRLREHNDPECYSSKFTKRFPGPRVCSTLNLTELVQRHSDANAG